MVFKARLGEDKSALIAEASRPGVEGPTKGQITAASASSSVKDAETSSMPPPAAKSSASTKASAAEVGASSAGTAGASQSATDAALKRPPSPTCKGPLHLLRRLHHPRPLLMREKRQSKQPEGPQACSLTMRQAPWERTSPRWLSQSKGKDHHRRQPQAQGQPTQPRLRPLPQKRLTVHLSQLQRQPSAPVATTASSASAAVFSGTAAPEPGPKTQGGEAPAQAQPAKEAPEPEGQDPGMSYRKGHEGSSECSTSRRND